MSNFQTFGAVTPGLEGSAPARFIGSTTDSLADILAAGYLNDKEKIVKANDIVEVNYLDASTFPLNIGESAVYQVFQVQYDPVNANWNLIPIGVPQSGIQALGVHSASFNNSGGSATTVVNDAAINPNSIVIARWKSSANEVVIEKVLPGNGDLTILSSGNPGSSVLDYVSFNPSVALQNAGVIGAQYANAGGSATLIIANAAIAATDVVMANLVSSANAVKVDKVTAGAGTITIVFSADPGVSVVAYMAIAPSSALAAMGLYSAQYTNAGGSATTTITDANITANSIVVADWSTQANAVQIEKVTPFAGSLVILSSADPGASILSYAATEQADAAQSGQSLQVVTVDSATPGTVRAFTAVLQQQIAIMTSGNIVGVRGEVDMVGASGGFVYGVQGKVIPTGTLSGSVWIAAVFAQFDLSHPAVINGAQLAAVWGDWGATGGTATDLSGCRGFAFTNTTSNVLNAQDYRYGNATYLMELAGAGGTLNYYAAAGTSGGSAGDAAHCAAQKVLKIEINGVAAYIPVFTQNS